MKEVMLMYLRVQDAIIKEDADSAEMARQLNADDADIRETVAAVFQR